MTDAPDPDPPATAMTEPSRPHRLRRRLLAAGAGVLAAAGITTALVLGHADGPIPPAVVVPAADRQDFVLPSGLRVLSFFDAHRRATAASGSQPWIAYVHGGGWVTGSVDESSALGFCNRMVRLGLTCFSLDYTLLPHATWPTQGDQVASELAWVRAHGARFRLDPRLGFIAGHSAGGLMAGVAGLEDGHLAGIVSLAGATNVPYTAVDNPDPNVSKHAHQLIGDAPLDSPYARSASVIDHVRPDTPRVPYLIVQEYGDGAVGVGSSTLLAAQLRRDGFPVTLRLYPGHVHSVNVAGPGVGATDRWIQARVAAARAQHTVDAAR